MSEYTFGTTVSGDFDGVIARVTSALADEGFGVLATIDISATLKAKIDRTQSGPPPLPRFGNRFGRASVLGASP